MLQVHLPVTFLFYRVEQKVMERCGFALISMTFLFLGGVITMSKIKQLLTPYQGLPKEVYILFVAKIINAMGSFVMPLLTIILTDAIGLSKQVAGVYLSLAGFLFIPASMIGGKLADTIGRKKVIIIFDSIAAVLYIVIGFMEPSIEVVYVLALAAMFMVAAGPAHDSLIADVTTPENRNGAYALSYMGWNIGFAIGPVIGGILYKNHLPWVFIGDAFTALLSLSLILFFIKETIHHTKEEINDDKRQMERNESGSIFSVLLKRPFLIFFALFAIGYSFAYSQWSYLLPMNTVESYPEKGAQYFGFLAGFNGFIVMVFTPILTKVTEKMINIRKVVYGVLLYALGFGMLGFFNNIQFFFLSAFIFTIGEIILSISATPYIINHTPASHRGRMASIISIIIGFGHTLGPIVMGKILFYSSLKTGWLITGLVATITAILMYGLERFEKKQEQQNIGAVFPKS